MAERTNSPSSPATPASPACEALLCARDLHLWYGRSHAVRGVSFDVRGGEITALLGANGAGKTSTLHMLTGILRPSSGTVALAGHPVHGASLEARRRIGYIPDRPDVYEGLTAREFVRFVCGLYGMRQAEADAHADPLFERFGLGGRTEELLGAFSFGMRQKAVIVATLAHEPELLVLDEPIVGLDPESARTLMEVLRERASAGAAVLFSTHLLGIAEEIADHFLVLHQGQLAVSGGMDDLRRAAGTEGARLNEAFFQLIAGAAAPSSAG
jgi:ABC-2 type transport system ATP-binding protein